MNRRLSTIGAVEWVERLGFLGTGMVLFATSMDLWAQNQTIQSLFLFLAVATLWLGGTGLFVLGLATGVKRPLLLLLVALIVAQLAYLFLFQQSYTPLTATHTDNEMIAQFSVAALKTGQNPYTWNFTDSSRVFQDRGMSVTPFLDGAAQYRLTYPALPVYLLFIFDRIGISDVRVVMTLFQITLLCLLFYGVPQSIRPVIILPLFVLRDFEYLPLAGVQDVVWSVMLIGVVLLKERPGWRAFLFGLAVAYRQQPWFIAPFLLIELAVSQQDSIKKRSSIIHFLTISSLTFLVVNLPFIVWQPSAWIMGILEPAYAAFNVFSHGFGALSTYGLVAFPRQFFTGLQLASFFSLLLFHARHWRSVGSAYWLFPAFFFWLYYRGLGNYWFYWIPPLLVAISQSSPIKIHSFSWQKYRLTLAGIGALMLPFFVWAILLIHRPPLVTLNYEVPLHISNYGQMLVDKMQVTVVNRSKSLMTPRFAVQRDAGVQALPWHIERGPENLSPGETGRYLISALIPVRAFPVETGGQLVVTDAGLDYRLRALATIPADRSFSTVETIINPYYLYWLDESPAPSGWQLKRVPEVNVGTVSLETVEDRPALRIEAVGNQSSSTPSTTQLVQWIRFDQPFSISMFPSFLTVNPQQEGFGIELDDGVRKLWVLFGERSGSGTFDENHHYIMIETSIHQWNRYTISPAVLYSAQGWQPPPIGMRNQGGLSIQTRQIQMSLFVSSSVGARSILFGPVLQDQIPANERIREQMTNPVNYYLQQGNKYRLQRNYQLAEKAYLQALSLDETNPEVFFGIGETRFWEGDWTGALAYFEKSLHYHYPWAALAYRGLGWSYYNLNEYSEAEIAFSEAIKLDPNMADAINGLGWTKLLQDKCAEAVPLFEQALSLDAQLTAAQQGISHCLQHEEHE